ncbi:MAG: glycosyltransferase family 2 protein [Acidobacteriota bacterium]
MTAAVVLLVSGILLLYILAGYPLLLGILRRRSSRPVRRGDATPTVTAIIAVYNGAPYLGAKLKSLQSLDYPQNRIQIIVASDGSSDETAAIARGFPGTEVLELPRGGKCAAQNAAIARATGEILLLTDVRQTLEPQSLRALVSNFGDPAVGVVSGLLKIRSSDSSAAGEIGAYWRYEAWIRDSLSAVDSIFGASGSLYAMRRELAVPMPEDILCDDMYLPLAAFRRGFRLIVEPQAVMWDYPTDRASEFHRKVRTLAGNYQLWFHYPWLLTPANRMWLHFLSYKAGRLFLPWLLIAIAVSTVFLPSPWREWLAFPQIAIYTLAALHPWLPKPLQRLSSPVRTFVVMMLAALAALQILFIPARRLWKAPGTSSISEQGAAKLK